MKRYLYSGILLAACAIAIGGEVVLPAGEGITSIKTAPLTGGVSQASVDALTARVAKLEADLARIKKIEVLSLGQIEVHTIEELSK